MFQLVAFKIHAIIKTVYCFRWLRRTFTGSSHWEVFFEINLNQKTLKLCTFWLHWKYWCRSTIRKHAVLWNKHLLTNLMKISLSYFMILVSFYTPWNTAENQKFLYVFKSHRRRSLAKNGLRVIQSSITYQGRKQLFETYRT